MSSRLAPFFSRTVILGFFFFILLRALFIERLPGLSYDEAWFANYSYRIAYEPGFWPLTAMMPYTLSWQHYLIAGFFKGVGVSIASLRALSLIEVLLALYFFSLSLVRLGEVRAGRIFVWIMGFSAAMVLDHRFSCEVTTFLPLCFSVLFFGVVLRMRAQEKSSLQLAYVLIAGAVLLGSTAHMLFVNVVLGGLAWLWFQGIPLSQTDRKVLGGIAIGLIPFLAYVSSNVRELNRITGPWLLFAILICSALMWNQSLSIQRYVPRVLLRWVGLAAVPFLICLALAFEGHWNVLFHLGFITNPFWIGGTLLIATSILYLGSREPASLQEKKRFNSILQLLCWVTLTTGVIAPRMTARYYEHSMILICMLLAMAIARLSDRKRRIAWVFWCLFQGGLLIQNYFVPHLQGLYVDRPFEFTRFRDRSTDFLPLGPALDALYAQGCGEGQIYSRSDRVQEVLQFEMRTRKLKETVSCPWKKIHLIHGKGSPYPGLAIEYN